MQSLVGHAEVLGDRLGAFAFEWSEEPTDVLGEAGALLGAMESFEIGSRKSRNASGQE